MTDTTQLPTHPIGIDADEPLHVTLYVRTNVSAVSRRQIDAVTERLQTLTETPLVDEIRVEQWPPKESIAEAGDTNQQSREQLVGKFEDWAGEHGVSLRPAIRRQTIPSSLAGVHETESRIRVPVMTLALHTDSTDALPRGVVPYTKHPETDEPETYTVSDWLAAAEAEASNMTPGRVRDADGTQSTV